MPSIPSVTCTVQTRFCHGGCTCWPRLDPSSQDHDAVSQGRKQKATRCQWRVCAAAVAACGSSASWIRGTRTLFSGSRLLEGASACVQCFVRKETASVRSVVRLWREDAGPRHDQNLGLLLGSPTAGMSILLRRLLDFGRSTTQNTTDDSSLLGLTCVSHPGRPQPFANLWGPCPGELGVVAEAKNPPKALRFVCVTSYFGWHTCVGSGRAGQGRASQGMAELFQQPGSAGHGSFAHVSIDFHYRAFHHMHSWLICLLE